MGRALAWGQPGLNPWNLLHVPHKRCIVFWATFLVELSHCAVLRVEAALLQAKPVVALPATLSSPNSELFSVPNFPNPLVLSVFITITVNM